MSLFPGDVELPIVLEPVPEPVVVESTNELPHVQPTVEVVDPTPSLSPDPTPGIEGSRRGVLTPPVATNPTPPVDPPAGTWETTARSAWGATRSTTANNSE